MILPESGYTPANLRAILDSSGMTQSAAAAMLGVDTRTVRKWLAEMGTATHRDMPLSQWMRLLDAIQQGRESSPPASG